MLIGNVKFIRFNELNSCTHYQIHLHCASYLVEFITFIIALNFIAQFDKTIIVDSEKLYYCFQNVNAFVKSVL